MTTATVTANPYYDAWKALGLVRGPWGTWDIPENPDRQAKAAMGKLQPTETLANRPKRKIILE